MLEGAKHKVKLVSEMMRRLTLNMRNRIEMMIFL